MSLPRVAEPHTPDVSGLSIGLAETPQSVTGKRVREEDWHPAELDILKMILARPPRDDLHYPPGALPPPDVLDELATFIIVTYRRASVARDESVPISTDEADNEPELPPSSSDSEMSESDDADVSFSSDRSEPSYPLQGWPHTWEATRAMLTHLALEDTRWAADRDVSKLSRRERLRRLKRTDSRDSIDSLDLGSESDRERYEREKLSRAQRLSNTLQASAREPPVTRRQSVPAPPPLGRTVSLGGPVAPPPSRPVPTHGQGALGLGGLGLGMPMRRNGSGRSASSTGSRRPSLLARGRSFTAQDLEDELALQERERAERERLVTERIERTEVLEVDAPDPFTPATRSRTKRRGSDTEDESASTSNSNFSPVQDGSTGEAPMPPSDKAAFARPSSRLIRSLSEMSRPRASVALNTRPGSEEPKGSPPMRGPLNFGPSLDMYPERRRSRRPTGPTLAMTAMAGAAALRSPGSPNGLSPSLASPVSLSDLRGPVLASPLGSPLGVPALGSPVSLPESSVLASPLSLDGNLPAEGGGLGMSGLGPGLTSGSGSGSGSGAGSMVPPLDSPLPSPLIQAQTELRSPFEERSGSPFS